MTAYCRQCHGIRRVRTVNRVTLCGCPRVTDPLGAVPHDLNVVLVCGHNAYVTTSKRQLQEEGILP